MAFDFLQNGLLGMGGLGGGQNDMPANALLGGFYDPKAMRNYQMKQMLLGLGAGLLAEKGFGKGAAMGIAAGDLAGRTYRDNAMDAYKLKQQADNQAFNRQWMIDNRNYERDRDKKADDLAAKSAAWQDELRRRQLDQWAHEDEVRQGKQTAVQNYMTDFAHQGGIPQFSGGVANIARQGGLEGPSTTDYWRVGQMQPSITAGDYETAFNGINATPPKPEQYTLGPGQQRRDEYGNVLAEGPPKTPDTVINNNGDMKLTEAQSKDVHYYARGKYANADLTANEGALLALGQQQGSNVPVVGNYLKSPEYRQAERAGKEFLAMILRKESGGAITAEEWQEYGPMFLPMPGDDQQTVADKRVARQRALDALKLGGGTAKPVFEQVDREYMASGLPPEAVSELKKDPSPQKRAYFDEVFGEGASSAVLGGN